MLAGSSRRPRRWRKTLTSSTRWRKASARASSGVPRRTRWYSCIAEPQPAAFVRMASTSAGKAARLRRAKARAAGRSPVCQASPPQQPCAAGTTTSTPFRASTSMVAVLMSGSSTRCAQPVSSATRARRSPRAGVTAGHDSAGGTCAGTRSSIGRSRAGTSGRNIFPNCPNHVATRKRAGNGMVCAVMKRVIFSPSERSTRLCVSARKGLIKSRYGTPLGHAGSQARQPRQRSMCGCAAASGRVPSSTSFISTMRPRGVSISCPSSR